MASPSLVPLSSLKKYQYHVRYRKPSRVLLFCPFKKSAEFLSPLQLALAKRLYEKKIEVMVENSYVPRKDPVEVAKNMGFSSYVDLKIVRKLLCLEENLLRVEQFYNLVEPYHIFPPDNYVPRKQFIALELEAVPVYGQKEGQCISTDGCRWDVAGNSSILIRLQPFDFLSSFFDDTKKFLAKLSNELTGRVNSIASGLGIDIRNSLLQIHKKATAIRSKLGGSIKMIGVPISAARLKNERGPLYYKRTEKGQYIYFSDNTCMVFSPDIHPGQICSSLGQSCYSFTSELGIYDNDVNAILDYINVRAGF